MREPARLLVAPCFSQNFFGGDYWVIVGPKPNNYTWAVLAQVSRLLNIGWMTTRNDTMNGAGL